MVLGGLANVISSAFIILLFMNMLTLYYSASLKSADTIRTGIDEAAESKKLEIRERISVNRLIAFNSTIVYGNVTNLGQTSIAARDFNKVDVILVYTALSNASKVSVRLSYDSTKTSANGWRATSVYTNGRLGETISPINVPSASSGMWDPDETVKIEIWLSLTNAVDNTQGISIIVASPNAAVSISSI